MSAARFLSGDVAAALAERAAHLRGARVFVTGGTGFVGRHLLPVLLDAGAEPTCLARASSRTDHLPGGVRVVQGDLFDGADVARLMDGHDVVIHMAAVLFGSDWRDHLRGNVGAAEGVAGAWRRLDAAGRAPRRLVFLSSLAASGPCAALPGRTDADVEHHAGSPVSAYGWSKLMAEQRLALAAGERLVCLRPPVIYGGGDRGLLPVFRGLKRGLAAIPGNGEFPLSLAHADDVVQAVTLCCRDGARGIHHVSDGRKHLLEHFYRAIGRALGRRDGDIRILRMPLALAGCAAALCDLAAGLARPLVPGMRALQWNRDKFREAREGGWLCDGSRIAAELGFSPLVDLEAGLREAAEFYRHEGLL